MRSVLNFLLATAITGLLFACNNKCTKPAATDQAESKKQIAAMLDSFNVAAANADYERYFNFFSDNANNVLDTVIKIKTPIEDSLISKLSKK